MPIKNDREYRSFDLITETRAEGDAPDYVVEGYASTFDEYELFRDGNTIMMERIDPKAFDDTDMSDVVFLLDHTGRVYARTKNETVSLTVDDNGLFTKTDLSKTTTSRAVYEDIKAGNYSQMSFAFTVDKDHFVDETDGDTIIIHRIIDRVKKVFDISAVGFPANPTTSIGVATRSAFDGEIERWQAERLEESNKRQAEARQRAIAKIKIMEAYHNDK